RVFVKDDLKRPSSCSYSCGPSKLCAMMLSHVSRNWFVDSPCTQISRCGRQEQNTIVVRVGASGPNQEVMRSRAQEYGSLWAGTGLSPKLLWIGNRSRLQLSSVVEQRLMKVI